MDIKQEILVQQGIAASIQSALDNHHVNPEEMGETLNFLANVIGALAYMSFRSKSVTEVLDLIKEEIEYGMEMGIPEK